ncbi:DUF1259 domain-containing protein [Streptomyces sp. NPDC020379]|uniref:DUF1259 domain-containing protein n=1 Tax=Streptomyces sp. NPDC020379 TaxID=3365071 RepID=UPI00379B4BD2
MSRRSLLAAGALASVPALAGTASAAGVRPADEGGSGLVTPVRPMPTTAADWTDIADVLGRKGNMARGTVYHTDYPREDLHVVSRGITVSSGLALGSHVAFVRYADGSTMVMGDLAVAEAELQHVTKALQRHGLEQTAIHKHLLAQRPDVWWTHVHGHGDDPVALARGVRAAMDRTGTPPPRQHQPPRATGLDTEGIDAAMSAKGSHYDGVYKCVFARRETIVDGGHVLPPGLGAISAFNFQSLGGGRAAVNGDVVMVADEVQKVLRTLSRDGIEVVDLHNHSLRDEPRLFFAHVWGVGDAVELAKCLRRAVAHTNVQTFT